MQPNTRFIAWGILIILAGVWGTSFLLIKYGLMHFSPSQVGSMRIVIAFIFLIPFALSRLRNLYKRDLLWLILSGFLGYLIPSLLFAHAEQVVNSSVAGILNSLTPIFTLIIAFSIFRMKFSWLNIIGVFMGLLGAMALMVSTNGGVIDLKIGYSLLIVIATILYAFNANIIKNKLGHLHSVDVTSFAFLMVGPVASVHLLFFTPVIHSFSLPGAGWGLLYIAILAIAGSALALMLFNYLIKITTVIFSTSVTYLIPVVATLAGIADREPFRASYLGWVAVILAGVFLVNQRGKVR